MEITLLNFKYVLFQSFKFGEILTALDYLSIPPLLTLFSFKDLKVESLGRLSPERTLSSPSLLSHIPFFNILFSPLIA